MSVNGILSVKEAAAKYKMISTGTCNCGGYHTEKFSDGVYTLSWRKTKYVFKLMRRNQTVKDWTPVGQLVSFLETHFAKKDAE